jgi:hypothetical protein
VPLAKGTRFLLVAGIGSAEQWASGGSSRLMTVGQGDDSCLGTSEGPSVTANPYVRPAARQIYVSSPS